MNGSRVDGGCKGNVTHHYCGAGSESFLTDGVDPVINTNDSKWANDLVTVRKNNATWTTPYDHAVLSFLFDPPVSLKSIRLSLFKCPQWGIGASNITVYADMGKQGNFFNFDFANNATIPLAQLQDVQLSCNYLVPVSIPLETDTQYKIWYIVVSFELQPDIDWMHVGEVEFINSSSHPPPSMNFKPGISIYCL